MDSITRPLSHGQMGLWLHHQTRPTGSEYNLPVELRIKTPFDVNALRCALESLVDRHEMLRTTFHQEGERVVQRIHERTSLNFHVVRLEGVEEAYFHRSISAEARLPFDLEHGPVFRAHLFIRSATEEILLLNFHHIISDAHSIRTFLHEFGRLYQACCSNTHMPRLTKAVPYEDFVVWQERLLAGDGGERMWAYWRSQFVDHEPGLALPTDRPRAPVATHTGSVHSLDIEMPQVARLEQLAHEQKVTLATVLLAAYYVLLHRYGDQDDITLYVPRHGRPAGDFSGTFGYFVAMGALRQDLSGNPVFPELLQRVRHVMRCARNNECFPLPLLLAKLQLPSSPERNPLAQAAFNFTPEAVSSLGFTPCGVDLSGLPAQVRFCETDVWIDLDFRIVAGNERVRLHILYNSDLWDRSTIEQLGKHYCLLLYGIVDAPARRIGDYGLLTAEEEHQLLHSWNNTAAPFPSDICLHNLIETQAAAYPHNVAVSCPLEELSYAILEQRANRLAHHLISRGIRLGDVVGVLLERSCDLIVGFLAILKAGAVYLPLDPRLPPQRLRFMLQDAGAVGIISRAELKQQTFGRALVAPHVESLNRCAIVLLDKDHTAIALHEGTPPHCPASSFDLAYVIYTSGSTGQPRGVMIEHRSACNMAEDLRRTYRLGPDSRVLQFASCGFDASLSDFMLALSSGGRLCMAPTAASLPGAELVEFMRRERITFAGLTPTAWMSLPSSDFPDLAVIKSVGEALPSSLIERWGEKRRIFNSYGPTETTVFCIRTEVKPDGRKAPIGRPAINTKAYILDRYGNPAPIGAIGELNIGGAGLARGYINRDELTRQLFRPNPFDDEPQSRIYRTGDLARYRSDGAIEFLGRKDGQIKIRGMRVELAEIEQCLLEHENVKACCVTLTDSPDKNSSLTAYVVRRRESLEGSDELRAFLRAALPSYMIPSQFLFLPQLPINRSGKIDRRALPEPRNAPNLNASIYPTSGLQADLAKVWKDVLNLDRVDVDDNFFDVGGHSLAVVQVQARIHDRLGIDCKILDLFEHTTIRRLATHLAAIPCVPPTQDAVKPSGPISIEKEPNQDGNAVAIIGMAGRFPGAENVDQFWSNLVDGIESIADLDEQTLREAGVDPETFGKPNYVRREAVVSGVDLFDAAFFGISPKEAAWMDPQQRFLLETAYQALDHAGYGSRETEGDRVGVFAGVGANHYLIDREPSRDLLDSEKLQFRILNGCDFTATRIAYKLNLTGPCVSVQTACSTSLVAVHLACQSLRSNECDMAMAGGASISLPHGKGYLHQQGHILSPDGHCRAFDAKAQGTVRGSGAAVVVLKRLSDACKDGDYIWAVIKGTAINNDGAAKVGFTAPSADGQAAVIQAALTDAGVPADTIGYVEAHGTGTYLGDPIEISGLSKAFRSQTARKQFCAIGSVKTNIGHLDAAAGVTGLIKVATMLNNGVIPASLHFHVSNPNIEFQDSPVLVNKTGTAWPKGDGPRRGGVSSFGIGGTNAHAILEEAPPRTGEQASRRPQVFPVSAASSPAMTEMLRQLAGFMRRTDIQHNAANIAYTLQKGRAALRYRTSFVGSDLAELADKIDRAALQAGMTREVPSSEPRIVFMFSGQGGQQIGMGRELYEQEPVFRSAIDECAKWLNEFAHVDFRALLYKEGKSESEFEPQLEVVMQPVIFATQYAMAKLFISGGIFPAAVIGHSIGEYAAAHIAGIISLPDAIRLTLKRGQLTSRVPVGGIVAVHLSPEELRPYWNERLSLAAINGPRRCVVSGAASEIAAFQKQLEAGSIASKRIHASHAVHSSMLDPILPEFRLHAEQVEFQAPQLPFMSTVLGDWLEAEVPPDGSYWVRNLRETVQFQLAFDRLMQSDYQLFVEMGPGTALSRHSKQFKSKSDLRSPISFPAMPGDDHGEGDHAKLLQTLGQLWTCGVRIDWSGLHHQKLPQRTPLPPYPFDRKRYWLDGAPAKERDRNADLNLPNTAALSVTRPAGSEEARGPTGVETSDEAALDRQIAEVYQDILGLDDVSLTDSFFDLGGDSLSALSVIDRIEQLTGERLAISQLWERQTPTAVAMALSKARGSARPSALVPIQTGGSWAPLFCPHPFGGHVLFYTPLAEALGPKQPLFGLQARGLNGEARPHLRIPEMAREYVEAIKSVQQRGPYQLAGLSMGGSIAWEMACQLRDAGDEVAILALLDAKALHKDEEVASGRYHGLLGNNPIPDWLSDQAVTMSVLFPALKKHWRKVKSMKREGQVMALCDFGRQAGHVPKMSDRQLDHILTIAEANRIALRHYTPRPNDSRAILFAAKKGLRVSSNLHDSDLGWKQFARGRLEIHEVPGNHYTMVAPPHVNVLAKILANYLDRND